VRRHGRALVAAVPMAWLLLFFLVPFLIVLKISFSEAILAMPPYTALIQWVDGQFLQLRLDLENFLFLFEDSLYWAAYLNSVKVAFVSTVFCLLVGYPMALGLARARPERRNLYLLFVILPFWTSSSCACTHGSGCSSTTGSSTRSC
jgi:putrescine transport system permease protein